MPGVQQQKHRNKKSFVSSDNVYIQGKKYRWLIKQADRDVVRKISYRHSLSLPIAQVLNVRGYQTNEEILSFLFSSYERDVPSAKLLKGVDVAAHRIIQAINKKEKILVFGDYDVDGVTSSSMVLSSLIPLGANINFFLPHRERDGYGLSGEAVKRAHQSGYSLIITVDNGITAYEAAQEACRLGIDLIITDHHQPHKNLPEALAIVNPNQHDCSYPFKSLAGVGVVFKLMRVVYEHLGINNLPEKTYELLLLGTIADVVPLVGENRFWVREGLRKVNKNKSNAIQILAQNSNLTREAINSLDIGFMIAPQINALGRLSDPRDAVRFLISSDTQEVWKIGQTLKDINEKRKFVEQGIYQKIEREIFNKQIDLEKEYVIISTNEKWPSGVIGLVAGKLMYNYGRPAFLFHIDEHGIAKGSCRSIPEINIFDILSKNSDLLLQFGGHACAAGLKLKQENLEKFKDQVSLSVSEQISFEDLQPKIVVDAPLQFTEINYKLLSDLEQLEPFGNKNPQPVFLVKDVTLLKQPQLLKEKHVKCLTFSQGVIKPVIFFNRPDLFTIFQNLQEKPFNLVAHVIKNEWQGNVRIELQGVDISIG